MAANTLAGIGLAFSRHILGASPTFQANRYKIKAGYASKIGLGDLVVTNTGGNAGYVAIAPNNVQGSLGVFAGVAPYFDPNLQQTVFSQWWTGTAPSTTGDVDCFVIDDPFALFRVQVSGGPWAQSWRGQNASFITGTNGVPNISGISTLVLDAASIATTNTLPFRIQELVGMTGGPQDPANTNPWVEVRLNLSEHLAALGI